MRKLFGVTAVAAALSAFGMVGTASAACPVTGSSGPTAASGVVVSQAGVTIYVDAGATRVGGRTPVGYAEGDIDIVGTNVSHSGEANGQASGLGYIEESGTAGTGGVTGAADGVSALGLVSGSGALGGGSSYQVAGVCQSVPVP